MTADANLEPGPECDAASASANVPVEEFALGHRDLDFDARFDETFRAAYRATFRLLGNRDDAKECTQEALTRAFSKWDRLTVNGDPLPWVVRVAINLAIDRVRRGSQRTAPDPLHGAERRDVAADTGLVDRLELQSALKALPRRQREAVALRFLGDFSEQQVANTLGISVGAVKQHTSRGLARLRAALKDS